MVQQYLEIHSVTTPTKYAVLALAGCQFYRVTLELFTTRAGYGTYSTG